MGKGEADVQRSEPDIRSVEDVLNVDARRAVECRAQRVIDRLSLACVHRFGVEKIGQPVIHPCQESKVESEQKGLFLEHRKKKVNVCLVCIK